MNILKVIGRAEERFNGMRDVLLPVAAIVHGHVGADKDIILKEAEKNLHMEFTEDDKKFLAVLMDTSLHGNFPGMKGVCHRS